MSIDHWRYQNPKSGMGWWPCPDGFLDLPASIEEGLVTAHEDVVVTGYLNRIRVFLLSIPWNMSRLLVVWRISFWLLEDTSSENSNTCFDARSFDEFWLLIFIEMTTPMWVTTSMVCSATQLTMFLALLRVQSHGRSPQPKWWMDHLWRLGNSGPGEEIRGISSEIKFQWYAWVFHRYYIAII